MSNWKEIQEKYLTLLRNAFEDEDILRIKVNFTDKFKLALMHSSELTRKKIIEDYFRVISDFTGCREDYEVLDCIIEDLIVQGVVTEEEVIAELKKTSYGR